MKRRGGLRVSKRKEEMKQSLRESSVRYKEAGWVTWRGRGDWRAKSVSVGIRAEPTGKFLEKGI